MSGSRQSLLPSKQYILAEDSDPLELLCSRFNVAKATLEPASDIPTTLDMRVKRDAHMPSHVLAVFDIPESEWGPSYQPLLVPIRVDLFTRGFRSKVIPPSPPGSTFPVPHSPEHTEGQFVTLPVIPLLVPHAPSIPLLLLFGLGLETRSDLLCCRLLPAEVIGEFPASSTMANLMATLCSDDQFREHKIFNQGLWKNILSLGPRDSHFIELAQTAWNVTVEARRIRQRNTAGNILSLPI
ncbi:uncharacterized protein EDB91DRAFT_352069 [Suillus paluster]|uniref:uncharacterized protein n=1 Tax=Suillus paluster TaxID=48578 RepID=UPI001B8813F0|nr:uncharacterized protein EDB91DRAFT_352069 [Suillus paluster]KAG1740484.1 hypothetical protein EDB91DRAFT_352069 [Suillus paluster]